MTQTITVSDELHALLYKIKATYGSQMTPATFLDYLVFGFNEGTRKMIIEQIAEKAKSDGNIRPEIASKVRDNL